MHNEGKSKKSNSQNQHKYMQESSLVYGRQNAQNYAYALLKPGKDLEKKAVAKAHLNLVSRLRQRNINNRHTASTTLKPLVQFNRVPELSAVCCTGNEKVNPMSLD